MRSVLVVMLFGAHILSCNTPSEKKISENVVTSDIDLFWNAYDKIVKTTDSLQQYQLLDSLYFQLGSPGLDSIRVARRYSAQDYIDGINKHPKFWASIRPNMNKAKDLSKVLAAGTQKLQALYPDLQPAKIYFTVGAFRTPGTTMDSLVLIGSELAMADKNTVVSEFSDQQSHLPAFFSANPSKNIVFLNTHEFVHTQQITTIGHNLLAQSLYEGVAEFVAEKALDQSSPNTCINYGKQNDIAVKNAFSKVMFSNFIYNWIMNSTENEFNTRDLGYYIGYAIADKHYEGSKNKQQAIKELIELDYTNAAAVESFVEQTQYFDKPISVYKNEYQAQRPTVIGHSPFSNGAKEIASGKTEITITFSQPMDKNTRGFELGALGIDNLLRVENVIGYSEDGTKFTFEATLKPKLRHQVEVSSNFRSEEGLDLIPYTIDIETTD